MKLSLVKSTLEESMAAIFDFSTKEQLVSFLKKEYSLIFIKLSEQEMLYALNFEHLLYDSGIDWDTYLVKIAGITVGYSDSKF